MERPANRSPVGSRGLVRSATDFRVDRWRGRAIGLLEKWPSPGCLRHPGTEPGLSARYSRCFVVFGCGSSREHAPIAIKASGVSAVIADTFARIFFRNAINIGLPLLESPEAVKNTNTGDVLEIDLAKGKIKNITSGKTFTAAPYPAFMSELISNGGLIEYTKKRLAGAKPK